MRISRGIYAQTEKRPARHARRIRLRRPQAQEVHGRRPAPGRRTGNQDIGTGEKLPDGKQGEIRYRSPVLFQGIYKQEKESKEVFDDEGYIKSGDSG